MKDLKIIKELTFEDYINSEYPLLITGNDFANQIKPTHKSWSKYNPEVYIVEADAKLNYGLDFRVMLRYKADGLNFLKEISYTSSSLTSSGIREVYSTAFTIKEKREEMILANLFSEDDFKTIIFRDNVYDGCEKNRKILRKRVYSTFY